MNQGTIRIREMNEKDIEGIFELEDLWKQEEVSYIFEPFTRAQFLETMIKFNRYHLVAIHNNQIIGYINGIIKNKDCERVFKRNEEYLMIENLYVRAEYRNQKIGSMLIETIMTKAKENNITNYAVGTDTRDMKSILRFYESHGFKPFHVELFKTN